MVTTRANKIINRKYLELNKKSTWDTTRVVFRGKTVASVAYIREEERKKSVIQMLTIKSW